MTRFEGRASEDPEIGRKLAAEHGISSERYDAVAQVTGRHPVPIDDVLEARKRGDSRAQARQEAIREIEIEEARAAERAQRRGGTP